MSIKFYLKKSIEPFVTKDPARYYEDFEHNKIKRRKGISYWTFYKGLRGDYIRHATACRILEILNVPRELWDKHIGWDRVNKPQPVSIKPEMKDAESLTKH